MFNKKKKKNKNIIENEVVEENVELAPESQLSEDLELSFDIENDEDIEVACVPENAITSEDELEEQYNEDIINLDGNGRKSFIEEEDLKFKEVIDDINTYSEPETNFINLDEDNEIISTPSDDIIEETVIEEETKEEIVEDLELVDEDSIVTETEVITEEDLIPHDEDEEDPKKLKTYFDDSQKQNKKLNKKNPKKKKNKKPSRRAMKQKQVYDDIQNQRIFKFRGKKYTKVEDFINYLNDNYLDIEKISKEVLDDKAFYGFIAKKSGVFDTSIKEFKTIKEEIDD